MEIVVIIPDMTQRAATFESPISPTRIDSHLDFRASTSYLSEISRSSCNTSSLLSPFRSSPEYMKLIIISTARFEKSGIVTSPNSDSAIRFLNMAWKTGDLRLRWSLWHRIVFPVLKHRYQRQSDFNSAILCTIFRRVVIFRVFFWEYPLSFLLFQDFTLECFVLIWLQAFF